MHCKNCRWWDSDGECNKVEWEEKGKPAPKMFQMNIRVADDTGLDVHLMTGPDFGCVQFEAKTN